MKLKKIKLVLETVLVTLKIIKKVVEIGVIVGL